MESLGYVATIGMFDGVHRGHQFVLQQVMQTAREKGLHSMAVTFDHTLHREQLLTTLDEKLQLIEKTGVEHVEVLQFTAELKLMTAREFMQQVLKEQLNVKMLLTGYDNRFGRNREEGFDDYVKYGKELGIDVKQLPPKGHVSSSLIRNMLTEGRVEEAAEALGYSYQLTGKIVHGHHIGTELGFPTANLMPTDGQQLVPASGVYAVEVVIDDMRKFKGMMNIGNRPTFDGRKKTLEIHVFNLCEDLYGHSMSVSFIKHMREERYFETPDELQEQLKKDALQAEQLL